MGKFIHAFWHIEGNSYQKLQKIFLEFRDFGYAWMKASLKELKKAGLEEEFIQKIVKARKVIDLERAMEGLSRNKVELIDMDNDEFPEGLKQIPCPPFLLYRRGAKLNSINNRVAIVGMRKSTLQGEKLAFGAAKQLSELGVTIVSGLAFGIDSAAHEGTLRSNGKTIGVLASGIGRITPASHQNLADRILEKGGAIISEYPVTAGAMKYQFLERNRLIAGLSHTTIIVEAAHRSGALITARHALEQGKEILAFPGDPGKISSQGCNNLIKTGQAELVQSISEIQENLQLRGLIKVSRELVQQSIWAKFELTSLDKKIIELVKREPLSTDELWQFGEEVMESLSKLEMAGILKKGTEMKWKIAATLN